MAYLIEKPTADELWAEAFSVVKKNGRATSDTKELLQVMMTLTDPCQKWVFSRWKPMSIAFAFAEVIWILSGENSPEIIDFWNSAYKKYAGDMGGNIYHGAYGYRLKHYNGLDQLERAYNALKNNPDNRQTVLLYWDPIQDLPAEDGKPVSKDIPCNICSLLKIREGKLYWSQIMRSNDLYKGLPYNLIQFTTLQEILAGWLNIKVGTYTHFSDSLHLYDTEKDICDYKQYTEETNKDKLSIDKADFDVLLNSINKRLHIIAQEKKSVDELRELCHLNSKYSAYNNIMFIMGAYAANKFGYASLVEELLKSCRNALYVDMMRAFLNR